MEKVKQLKLFQAVETWEDIKNMGLLIKFSWSSRGKYGNDYAIRLNKNILQYVSMEKLEKIMDNNFSGYYGGFCKINILTDEIFIKYSSYND